MQKIAKKIIILTLATTLFFGCTLSTPTPQKKTFIRNLTTKQTFFDLQNLQFSDGDQILVRIRYANPDSQPQKYKINDKINISGATLTQKPADFITIAPHDKKYIDYHFTTGNIENITDKIIKINQKNTEIQNSRFQINKNLDSKIKITGENLQNIKNIYFANSSTNIAFEILDDTTLLLQINENQKIGEFSIIFDAKGKKIEKTLIITGDDSPAITSISPPFGRNDTSIFITLTGINFDNIRELWLNNPALVKLQDVKVAHQKLMTARIPAGLSTGEYEIYALTDNQILKIGKYTSINPPKQ